MRRDGAAKRVLSPKQEQSEHANGLNLVIRLDGTQRLGQFDIRECDERFVAAPATLTDGSPKPFELKGIQILPLHIPQSQC